MQGISRNSQSLAQRGHCILSSRSLPSTAKHASHFSSVSSSMNIDSLSARTISRAARICLRSCWRCRALSLLSVAERPPVERFLRRRIPWWSLRAECSVTAPSSSFLGTCSGAEMCLEAIALNEPLFFDSKRAAKTMSVTCENAESRLMPLSTCSSYYFPNGLR